MKWNEVNAARCLVCLYFSLDPHPLHFISRLIIWKFVHIISHRSGGRGSTHHQAIMCWSTLCIVSIKLQKLRFCFEATNTFFVLPKFFQCSVSLPGTLLPNCLPLLLCYYYYCYYCWWWWWWCNVNYMQFTSRHAACALNDNSKKKVLNSKFYIYLFSSAESC